MTRSNGIRVAATPDTTVRGGHHLDTFGVPWSRRMWARLFAIRYDGQIDAGVAITPGSPLAAHHSRLTTRRERADMAHALSHVIADAGLAPGDGRATARVPIRAEPVRQSADLVRDVLSRLSGPLPVRARGMARLRILLGDGCGPLYRSGPGTLAAALRGILAAL